MKHKDLYATVRVPVYLINLPERTDRLEHITQQFEGRTEFDLTIIEANKHKIGAIGLWQSIIKVINIAIEKGEDVIILCEDDHEFTPYYSTQRLFDNIVGAAEQGAKILLGGISNFGQAIPIAKNRCWIDNFQCTQFTIVYRSFFQQILNESFGEKDAADLKFSEMTSHKMVFYPYISTQKDFGYSDIPIKGLPTSQYAQMFDKSLKKLEKLYNMSDKYGGRIK